MTDLNKTELLSVPDNVSEYITEDIIKENDGKGFDVFLAPTNNRNGKQAMVRLNENFSIGLPNCPQASTKVWFEIEDEKVFFRANVVKAKKSTAATPMSCKEINM